LNVFQESPEKVRKFLSDEHYKSKVSGRAHGASPEKSGRVRKTGGLICEFPDKVQELLKGVRNGDNRHKSSLMSIKPIAQLDYSNIFLKK
jgi:hypothetical protein